MLLSELVSRLVKSLDTEADALEALHQHQRANRFAFIALRPRDIESAMSALQSAAQRVAECAQQREQARKALATALHHDERSRLSALVTALPAPLRPRLQQSRQRALRAGSAVRVENGAGTHLLDFARQCLHGLFASATRESQSERTYDCRARGITAVGSGGRLITGTI